MRQEFQGRLRGLDRRESTHIETTEPANAAAPGDFGFARRPAGALARPIDSLASPATLLLVGALAAASALTIYGNPNNRDHRINLINVVPRLTERAVDPAPQALTRRDAGQTDDATESSDEPTTAIALDMTADTLAANALPVPPLMRWSAENLPNLGAVTASSRRALDLVQRYWAEFALDLFPARGARPNAPPSPTVAEEMIVPLPTVETSVRTVAVARGDTLPKVLQRAGVDADEARDAAQKLAGVFNPRRLQAGQELTVTFARQAGDSPKLAEVSFADGVERTVGLTRQAEGLVPHEILHPLDKSMSRSSGRIDDSLYQAALNVGMPQPVLSELIKLYSYDVDFQREIQPGDSFDVLYESYRDDHGKIAKTGRILGALMTLSGKELRYYFFQPPGEAEGDYFTPRGQSVRKALLRTPIDGAKLTSGFGRRTHPILGYSIMHKGIDFGAAAGTPIQAAGSGTVMIAGMNKGYGNYVKLRHANGYATAYAHMSRMAVKPGQTVRQGQVIGYVGSTGLSTGPHLHYEVHINDHQVNPQSVRLPTGRNLEARELGRFRDEMARIDRQFQETPSPSWLARN